MRRSNAALVVATLALAIAATGTAGAAGGWINGSKIKPHTITSLQLAKGAVKAPNVADHAIHKLALADGVIIQNTVNAPAGPQGDPGTPGAPGSNGVAALDPSRLTTVDGPPQTVSGSGRVETAVLCPIGTYVVGGGHSEMSVGPNTMVIATASGPIEDNGQTGWRVVARDFSGAGETGSWHVIAICAAA